MCTCSLPVDNPHKPPSCICLFEEHEVWNSVRMPKFSIEDVFYILCAVFWDPASCCNQWRDTILYHFVCEGDEDFSRARNLVSSLLGRFYKSEFNSRIMKLEPGQSWAIYDAKKFSESSLVTKANFIAFRGEIFYSQNKTLVNFSNRDCTSVYDHEPDHYTNTLGGEEEQPNKADYDDGDTVNEQQGHRDYDNNNDGDDVDGEKGEEASDIAIEPDIQQPRPVRHMYPDSQQSFAPSQGISCKTCKGRNEPPKRAEYTHPEEVNRISEPSRPQSRLASFTTAESVANNAPAPSVVSMINSWAPTVSRFGGEVRISRFGSATIKFPPRKNNTFG